MLRKIIYLFILFAICIQIRIHGQKLEWNVTNLGFFDNREYAEFEGQKSQTFFGNQLSPIIGLGIGDHHLQAGVSWIYSFGSNIGESIVAPIFYYNYRGEQFSVAIGSFPYSMLSRPLPYVVRYDSLSYFRPNVEGALLQYQWENGVAELMCDWRGAQTTQRREAFTVLGQAFHQWSVLGIGGIFKINHLAGYAPGVPHVGVSEELLIMPQIMGDFSKGTPFEQLFGQISYLYSPQRKRYQGDQWTVTQGVLVDFAIKWKRWQIKDMLYIGNNFQPFYREFGSVLYQGDPFFQAKVYNRTDLRFYFLETPWVNCYASINFHVADGTLNSQQQLILQAQLDSKIWEALKLGNKKTLKKMTPIF